LVQQTLPECDGSLNHIRCCKLSLKIGYVNFLQCGIADHGYFATVMIQI